MKINPDAVVTQELATRGVDASVGVFGDHHVKIGKGTPIRLDEIVSAKVPSAGFKTATKILRGKEGVKQTARDALATLVKGSPFDAQALLGLLKASQTHINRLAALNQLTQAQLNEKSWVFTHAVEALKSSELAAVYQALTSAEMDLLRTALEAEGRKGSKDARMVNERLFDLEALVLRETSRRASETQLEDLRMADPYDQSLWGESAPKVAKKASEVFGNADDDQSGKFISDIKAPSLATVVNAAAASATQREKSAQTTQQGLQNRGFADVTLKQMGDVMRSKEITINMDVDTFFNKSEILKKPGKPLETYWSLKEQGIDVKGPGYGPRRDAVETNTFPELRHSAEKGKTRPVYGALNMAGASYGAADVLYGNVVIVLKPEVAKRATFATDDSFQLVRVSITEEKKKNFFALFSTAEGIPDELKVAVAKADSPEHAAVEQWVAAMEKMAQHNNESGAVCRKSFIPKVLADYFPKEGAERDLQGLMGLALKCFADSDATSKVVATHDNIESLIPAMGEVNANALAEAARKMRNGGDGRIGLNKIAYIEAQIHGPVIPERDIAEIRVNLYGAGAEEMDEGQRAQAIEKLRRFEAQTGIRVVIADEGAWELEHEELDRLQADTAILNAKHHDLKAIEARRGEVLANIKDEAAKVLADNSILLKGLPDDIDFTLDGQVLDKIAEKFLESIEEHLSNDQSDESSLGIVKDALRFAVSTVVSEKVALLKEMVKLDFAGPAQRKAFAKWVIEAKEIRSAEEMRLVHKHATAQAALMRDLLAAEPAPAADSVLKRFAALSKEMEAEFGAKGWADNATAHVSFTSLALLRDGEPPVGEEGLARLKGIVDSPQMRGYMAQLGAVAGADGYKELPDGDAVKSLRALLALNASNLSQHLGAAPWKAPEPFTLPLELVRQPVREAIATVAPETAGRLNFRNPVHPAFPKPANADALPKNAAERRAFLVSVMEEYRQKELGPEKGRAFHGRGHIVRAFIYATAMVNILKEQGVEVDFNAVLCGIAGHDLARARPGKDRWEAQSGEMTVAAMNNAYGPDALGASYAQEVVDSIIGVEVNYPGGFKTSVPKSPTLEAHILQSADSLDIGRVQIFDPRQFAFLQYGAKEMPENIARLRDQLAKEADLLQRLTNPLCASYNARTKLDDIALMTDGEEGNQAAEQSANLLSEGEEQLIAQAHDGDNEAFVANVESLVRDNPQLFPVLSKYYIG